MYTVDWGILDSLRLLDRGKLPLDGSLDAAFADQGTFDARASWPRRAVPDTCLSLTPRGSSFSKAERKLIEAADGRGIGVKCSPRSRKFGRPTYEVYRFVKR